MVERIRVSPDVAWVEDDDRVVVIRLTDLAADPLVLADSAAAVWRAVGDGASRDEVVEIVAAAYAIEPSEVDSGVAELIDHALGLDILTSA